MSNYNVLYGLRILKKIKKDFVDSFFILYFLQVSNSNILPIGIYKLVAVITLYSIIFLSRNFCKTKHRTILLRIGVILEIVYFLSIMVLKERIINYVVLVGFLYGIEEGFYYSVYNTIESDGIKNEERAKFGGSYIATKSILSIILPLFFGGTIYTIGFTKSLIILLVICFLQIILSLLYNDDKIPESNRTDMKEFLNITKKDERIKKVLVVNFFNGMTYSEGAFSYIVTIYIAKIFSDSFSLGIFTSIFSLVTACLGIMFAKFIKQKHYAKFIKISMFCTVVSLCAMLYNCNATTVIVFNLFQVFSKELMSLINGNSQSNISNLEAIRKEYKVEYWLSLETALVIARIISNSFFILMAFTDVDIMIYIFIVFLILFAKASINLQKCIEENR